MLSWPTPETATAAAADAAAVAISTEQPGYISEPIQGNETQ